jgi:hypothetical protein
MRQHLGVHPKFNKLATEMLVEFANTRSGPEAAEYFQRKWTKRLGLSWGDSWRFENVQGNVQRIWKGSNRNPATMMSINLGFNGDGEVRVPIVVDWNRGMLTIEPHTLDQLIWLILLQYSARLGICENHGNGGDCVTPYFLKYRPKQRFCSDPCTAPARRESARLWWSREGDKWLAKRRGKKSRTQERAR